MNTRMLKRLLRGAAAYIGAAVLIYGARYLTDTPALDGVMGIGWSATLAGVLMAMGKFVREKYGVDFTP